MPSRDYHFAPFFVENHCLSSNQTLCPTTPYIAIKPLSEPPTPGALVHELLIALAPDTSPRYCHLVPSILGDINRRIAELSKESTLAARSAAARERLEVRLQGHFKKSSDSQYGNVVASDRRMNSATMSRCGGGPDANVRGVLTGEVQVKTEEGGGQPNESLETSARKRTGHTCEDPKDNTERRPDDHMRRMKREYSEETAMIERQATKKIKCTSDPSSNILGLHHDNKHSKDPGRWQKYIPIKTNGASRLRDIIHTPTSSMTETRIKQEPRIPDMPAPIMTVEPVPGSKSVSHRRKGRYFNALPCSLLHEIRPAVSMKTNTSQCQSDEDYPGSTTYEDLATTRGFKRQSGMSRIAVRSGRCSSTHASQIAGLDANMVDRGGESDEESCNGDAASQEDYSTDADTDTDNGTVPDDESSISSS